MLLDTLEDKCMISLVILAGIANVREQAHSLAWWRAELKEATSVWTEILFSSPLPWHCHRWLK